MVKPPPPSRPRSAEQTRAEILRAARHAFATRGYAQSGVREIAADAGITAALIVRYFGSKKDLFLTVLAAEMHVTGFFEAGRERFGEHVIEYLTRKPTRDDDTLSILLLGAGDEEIRADVTRVFQEQITKPLAEWLGGPDAEARAALILSVISGLWMYRVLLPLDPLTASMTPATKTRLATMLQALVDT
ncbi:Transcriptional regulator, TetR family [Chondromyces apiculatus DSM 436]|uniref:Transcriptional regulator, TetR family n=2 Tax=Chondromyces apiculatus TaxID=51 RepID=A0A017TDJ0_9BACT|nr:Transcriptional regulator, TetR family [Chondromyces apiculatus DSM 436]